MYREPHVPRNNSVGVVTRSRAGVRRWPRAKPYPNRFAPFCPLCRYVADVLADFRLAKANSKEAVQSKLLFRKRMFRETDESITEPM